MDTALADAFLIGKQAGLIRCMRNDVEVGTGRHRNEIEANMRKQAAAVRGTPPEKRQTIIAKRKRGMSYQAIARDLKCSKKTVSKVIHEHQARP